MSWPMGKLRSSNAVRILAGELQQWGQRAANLMGSGSLPGMRQGAEGVAGVRQGAFEFGRVWWVSDVKYGFHGSPVVR